MNKHTLISTLYEFLTSTESQVRMKFKELQGYKFISSNQSTDYLLCIPTTPKHTPVMLCAHVDTLATSNIQLIVKDNFVSNHNGILGADDRAGCALLYNIANNFANKPIILLTSGKEDNNIGMHSFVETNIFNSLKNSINHIVSIDASGHRLAKYYGSAISEELEELLCELSYTIRKGSKPTDGYILEQVYGIPHINISHGGKAERTKQEFIDLESYQDSYLVAEKLIRSITSKHKVCMNTIIHTPEYVDDDVCEICGNLCKRAIYDDKYELSLCMTCRGRLDNRNAKELGQELIATERKNIRKQQTISIMSNLNKLLGEQSPFINKQNSRFRYSCPLCGSDKIVHVNSRGCDVCLICKHSYLLEREKYITDRFNGDIIRHKHSKGKDTSTVVHLNTKYVFTEPDKNLISQSDIMMSDEDFIFCHKCEEYHPRSFSKVRKMLLSTQPVQEIQLNICSSCVKTI